MFCVIQKIQRKRNNPYGAYRSIEVYESYKTTVDGIDRTKYAYRYSGGRFERPIRDAYKIMIHESYRGQGGKVRKRQWVICTMDFYSLIDSWPGDHITSQSLDKKVAEMGIPEDIVWKLINDKLDPIVAEAKKAFKKTDEYKVNQKHQKIINKHIKELRHFDTIYGDGSYERCYDVFGELRDPDYLQHLKTKREQERERSSYRDYSGSTYGSNFNWDDFYKQFSGSYSVSVGSTYTDDEKQRLKKIFRSLCKTFHPDITKDDGETMKLINKLKEGWGI